MKAAILILIVCAFAFSGYAADEPEYSASAVESLTAALPTSMEIMIWRVRIKGKPEAEKEQPELAAKMTGGEYKKCEELFSMIKTGKSILDYPGMLPLGNVTWDAKLKTYTLRVEATDAVEQQFAGFDCVFSADGKITGKTPKLPQR